MPLVNIQGTSGNKTDVTANGELRVCANIDGGIAEWALTQTSSANAEQTLSKAGETNKTHVVTAIDVAISGGAAGNDISIQLKDDTTVKWQTYIGHSAPRGQRVGIVFAHGIAMTIGKAANLYVGAGGDSVVTAANMAGYTK